jgi:hypothetical protein
MPYKLHIEGEGTTIVDDDNVFLKSLLKTTICDITYDPIYNSFIIGFGESRDNIVTFLQIPINSGPPKLIYLKLGSHEGRFPGRADDIWQYETNQTFDDLYKESVTNNNTMFLNIIEMVNNGDYNKIYEAKLKIIEGGNTIKEIFRQGKMAVKPYVLVNHWIKD